MSLRDDTGDTPPPPFLQADALSALPAVRHGFFTRRGGVSEGIWRGLNVGSGSADNAAHVQENRRLAMAALGRGGHDLATLYQVHGADVVQLSFAPDMPARPRADAMVTRKAGLVLGILTADCVPVLFADPVAGVIGAAHAGWRGALAGVTANVIAAMQAMGAEPPRIHAAVGPAIGPDSYAVGPEFRRRFLAVDASYERYFRPDPEAADKTRFAIAAFVADGLQATGCGQVELLVEDTCAAPEMFFSYRRACQRGEPDYGRQLSAITLDGN